MDLPPVWPQLTGTGSVGTTLSSVAQGDVFVALVVAVLGLPVLAAMVGTVFQREKAYEYTLTAAAAIVAVFTLTGTVQFDARWTILGIVAVMAAIVAHVWQYRHDRATFLVVASIYVMPVSLASILLLREVRTLL